jgi:glycosyltransferase involved in cell wall biosynthesis
MKILLLIPAFNEEPSIVPVIREAKKYIRDIMVIDDGSTDATTLVSSQAGAMIHRFKENRGKGEALKFGFQYAVEQGYDYVITMDGDGQHAAADIDGFLPMLGSYDLILGNRMDDRAKVPWLRRIANLTSSMIVSILCGQRVYDSQTGFRAYSAKLLRDVKLRSSRYDLESEVVIKAARQGFKVGHCHIQTIYAGEVSRFRNVKDSLRFLAIAFKSLFWR